MDLTRIKADIPRMVREWSEKHATQTGCSFVGVLSCRYGEIVERAFAVRRYAKKGILITEVRRRATGSSRTVVRNLIYNELGHGYIPVFEKKDRYSYSGGYGYKVFGKEDFDKWYLCDISCNFNTVCLNGDMLTKVDEFKYCGYSSGDVIAYLNEYRNNPSVEFLGKLDLPLSPLLMKKAQADKRFRTYIFKHASAVRLYGSRAADYAYRHGMTISEAYERLTNRRRILADIPAMRGHDLDYERVADYCRANGVGFRVYNDYIEAVIALGLDLNDTKNIYPKDFNAIHDLRVAEYASLKAKADRIKRKELYESFAKAGEKATAYERSGVCFSMIAPRDIGDLMTEGAILGHCVGQMGYDKKMADGDVVIMFLRQASDLGKPFVTIEYDLHKGKLLQAYGAKNTAPPSDAAAFINEWVGMMKKIDRIAV